MRFALGETENRIEATPGAQGKCPGCGAELLAKCGTKKVWHWAHKGQRHCDHWWENETQWHRDWKNSFPTEWQECPAWADDGELHIADIRTPHGLVVEFQHSYLKPEEARKRTDFHRPIIWVVDGTRRKTDHPQFEEALTHSPAYRTRDGIVNQVWKFQTRLLKEWVNLGVITAFDFGGDAVWMLRHVRSDYVFGFNYPKAKLIAHISEGTQLPEVLFNDPTWPTTRYRRRRSRF